MLRLSFAWRVTLVLILALIALQVVSSMAYFIQRDATTASGFRAPLPDQVAALAILLDKPAGRDSQLLLRALNGPGLSVSILDEPLPLHIEPRRLVWLEQAIRRNLPDGDQRGVVVTNDGPSAEQGPPRPWRTLLFIRGPIEIFVGLSGGRSLYVRTTDSLNARLFGLPVGFLASLLGFAIALLAGLAILRETRPLGRLAAAVERFGQGMQAEALPENGAPEMRSLVRAFNAMQARIARLVHGRTFVVAAIAHDLRTHLTRLRLRVAMISEDRIRERAERDVEEMQALVEEALFYAKATRHREDRTTFDLVALVDEVCQSRAEAGASVTFTRPAEAVAISATRLSIGRAIGNLVDNAVVYGGAAEIGVERHAVEVTVWIDDRGPGIPQWERERILEPFERLETSRGRDTGGTGLGLAIVREIIDAHGGRVIIADRPGGGSRFGLVLPLLGTPG